MGLVERMMGLELPKIAAHQFTAAIGELERGNTTRAQVITFFGISAGEEAELDALTAKILPPIETYPLGGYTVLTSVGTTYDAIAPSKGLGFVRIQGAGATGVEFAPRFNKVGSGTLSWQLWNETSGAEILVITDAVVGDNKSPVSTFTLPAPLAIGMHILRVRCKSTVAGDSPVYYGAVLRVMRTAVMWSKILEEVLVLAEKGYPTLDTAAEVRTRLGI